MVLGCFTPLDTLIAKKTFFFDKNHIRQPRLSRLNTNMGGSFQVLQRAFSLCEFQTKSLRTTETFRVGF